MITTNVAVSSGSAYAPEAIDAGARYAAVTHNLARCRDFCVTLALVLFFGRSLWAWLSDRSWIVGPDTGAVYVLGFPALFLLLSARDLPLWIRLRTAQRTKARLDGRVRPWQYVAAGAILGASTVLAATLILTTL